ncbi:hypothetical protein [Streptomyces salinarius]|uniref:hypothetical protein n=1 Tax=Streptomyces salinarius TaxID=2762598 RepID=UPI0028527B3B|nr:hypothetical protein [Streptomyces salinarius]
MTPGERWVQRVMGNLGARPLGHAEQTDDEDTTAPAAPVVPIQPTAPAPDWPPAGARRISTTAAPGSLPAPGHTITLKPDDEDDANAAPEKPVEDEGQDDETEADDVEEAPAAPPVPNDPVAKVPRGAKPVKPKPRRGPKLSTDDPSLRITVFNLTAAAAGYGTPFAGIVETYLTFAEQAARGVFAFLLAVAGAVGTWWVTGRPGVREVLAVLPYWPVIRLAACLGLAETGRRFAPVLVARLNETGTGWGLGPNAVSFLITSVGITFALWWFIDRRFRRFHWIVRWFFRIPLATAAVVTLAHGNPIS